MVVVVVFSERYFLRRRCFACCSFCFVCPLCFADDCCCPVGGLGSAERVFSSAVEARATAKRNGSVPVGQ